MDCFSQETRDPITCIDSWICNYSVVYSINANPYVHEVDPLDVDSIDDTMNNFNERFHQRLLYNSSNKTNRIY